MRNWSIYLTYCVLDPEKKSLLLQLDMAVSMLRGSMTSFLQSSSRGLFIRRQLKRSEPEASEPLPENKESAATGLQKTRHAPVNKGHIMRKMSYAICK